MISFNEFISACEDAIMEHVCRRNKRRLLENDVEKVEITKSDYCFDNAHFSDLVLTFSDETNCMSRIFSCTKNQSCCANSYMSLTVLFVLNQFHKPFLLLILMRITLGLRSSVALALVADISGWRIKSELKFVYLYVSVNLSSLSVHSIVLVVACCDSYA